MATMAQIADKKSACGGADANTGKLGCKIQFGTPLHVIKLPARTVISSTETFNKAFIDTQTQKGLFLPIMGAEAFEPTSGEDAMSSNSSGVEQLNLRGLPKYEFLYEEGHEFYKNLSKLTSFKEADFIIGDEEGNWRMVVDSDGNYRGFTAGQVTALMTKEKVQGGDSEGKKLTIQFLNRKQWDDGYIILAREELDFSPEEVGGVNGVVLSYDTVPSATDTTLDITAILDADNSTPVSGLIDDDFIVTVDGSPVSITSVVEGLAGKYVITIPALVAAEVVVVYLWDDTIKTFIILNSNELYRSNKPTETVVA